jgi:thiamine-monophosphate kinase
MQWALAGGEDYELCFTLPMGEDVPKACTVIGQVEEGEGMECDFDVNAQGYEHF